MPTYFVQQPQCVTIASALRSALEEITDDSEFVSCAQLHPLDEHIEIQAASKQVVRTALLNIKDKIARARKDVETLVVDA